MFFSIYINISRVSFLYDMRHVSRHATRYIEVYIRICVYQRRDTDLGELSKKKETKKKTEKKQRKITKKKKAKDVWAMSATSCHLGSFRYVSHCTVGGLLTASSISGARLYCGFWPGRVMTHLGRVVIHQSVDSCRGLLSGLA